MNTLTKSRVAEILDTLNWSDDCTYSIDRQFPAAVPLTSLIRRRNETIRDTLLRVSLSDVTVETERSAAQ